MLVHNNKNDESLDHLLPKMASLRQSINNICQESSIPLGETLKSSNSILGKLYKLFLSLKDKKDYLLSSDQFYEFIMKKTEGLNIQLNQTDKYSMNFIHFIKQIDRLAKENQLSREYVYRKLLDETSIINNQNQSNNALDSSISSNNILLNEYNNDLSSLKRYFIKRSEKSKDKSDHRMKCPTFIECISQDINLNKIDNRLQLNNIFNNVCSLLVNQEIYLRGSDTIDFLGFILCLKEIAQIFHFNLRLLIKHLINSENKSNIVLYPHNKLSNRHQLK